MITAFKAADFGLGDALWFYSFETVISGVKKCCNYRENERGAKKCRWLTVVFSSVCRVSLATVNLTHAFLGLFCDFLCNCYQGKWWKNTEKNWINYFCMTGKYAQISYKLINQSTEKVWGSLIVRFFSHFFTVYKIGLLTSICVALIIIHVLYESAVHRNFSPPGIPMIYDRTVVHGGTTLLVSIFPEEFHFFELVQWIQGRL